MRRAILGTAGHIDHGKTALVRALTGVDTDRLKEEKERGITIDLGFAELRHGDELVLGVVDVPGHEDFVRTMVAGASGMDLVLLAVAADEGVMPQTREHLAVVELLGVPEMVVAVTKADLVEEAWLELVEDELRETLASGPWAEAPVVATSARTGAGLDDLRHALFDAAARSRHRRVDDLFRLPVDRSFTVQGTGTVVTGTLWSGTLEDSATVRILPGGIDGRVRGIQIHGAGAGSATAGARTAVALSGSDVDRTAVGRGDTLVDAEAPWPVTHMLTVRARVLPDTGWRLEHNQRLHVHLGTQEVLARCAVLEGSSIEPGAEGWIQLRLEEPVTARSRDRVVLRSYSPVTTLGGGQVAEPDPPKRKHLDDPGVRDRLRAILDAGPDGAVEALVALASWRGAARPSLPVLTGLAPREVESGITGLLSRGGTEVQARLYAPEVVTAADGRILDALDQGHEAAPLRPDVPLVELRRALPGWAGPGLADARLQALAEAGRLEIRDTGARRPGHRVRLTPEQETVAERLRSLYREAGLQPPDTAALPDDLLRRDDLEGLLSHLGARGELTPLGESFWIWRPALEEAVEAVRRGLGGDSGLGPADFRDALPVTRKHLLPILGWMDQAGVTVRRPDGREVVAPEA